ncbi:hypothetical protein [Flexithrix dorotheae]|uniref:hypothetical protein n=1 Tax=Flexithrix dorotheae TaxID=70993 RepID=UPI00036FB72A|nr:hypothetical protein [Flexithrix dorotheae]
MDEEQGVGLIKETRHELNNKLNFLGIHQKKHSESLTSSVNILRSGYFEGEQITSQVLYSSVWTVTAFYSVSEKNDLRQLMPDYMLKWICKKLTFRKPEFYYNTCGMKRNLSAKEKHIREVLTLFMG